MTKTIKKKTGWSRHVKPHLETAPKPPQKMLENVVKETELYNMGNFGEYNLGMLLSQLPPGSNLYDVNVSSECSHGGYDDEIDVSVSFFLREMKTIENLNYDKQLKNYDKNYKAWLLKKTKHVDELKEWSAWVKQEDEKDHLLKLTRAKKLLESNGMKVI